MALNLFLLISNVYFLPFSKRTHYWYPLNVDEDLGLPHTCVFAHLLCKGEDEKRKVKRGEVREKKNTAHPNDGI